MADSSDEIQVEELEVFARVGVPDEERATPQRLTITLVMRPRRGFEALGDDLSQTIDYATVCDEVRSFVSGRADRLIETLADALAKHLLSRFELARVELELRKFVLPGARYVAVRVTREAAAAL